METYKRRQLANMQLERGLELFLDCKDYASAATLAGAAEMLYAGELRATLPESQHRLVAIEWTAKVWQLVSKFYEEEVDRKTAINQVNAYRDALKHYQDGAPVQAAAREAAWSILDRAHSNRLLLGERDLARFGEAEEYMSND